MPGTHGPQNTNQHRKPTVWVYIIISLSYGNVILYGAFELIHPFNGAHYGPFLFLTGLLTGPFKGPMSYMALRINWLVACTSNWLIVLLNSNAIKRELPTIVGRSP